jgi:hypothetical protein
VLAQNPHVFTQRRLTNTQLLCDEHRAHAVLHQISVNLRAKVRLRVLQPIEDLEPSFIADGLNCDQINHIVSLLSDDLKVNDEQMSCNPYKPFGLNFRAFDFRQGKLRN